MRVLILVLSELKSSSIDHKFSVRFLVFPGKHEKDCDLIYRSLRLTDNSLVTVISAWSFFEFGYSTYSSEEFLRPLTKKSRKVWYFTLELPNDLVSGGKVFTQPSLVKLIQHFLCFFTAIMSWRRGPGSVIAGASVQLERSCVDSI